VNYTYKKSPAEKKALCVEEIVNILSNEKSLQNYPYLAIYKSSLEAGNIDLNDKNAV
tara:strand:- start:285 stop:455 length:171 start_codon:yes stop_codon:yes gene_type:complete